jgi:radical SAM superfamily enzyme YgiQ (UPF0313 family)
MKVLLISSNTLTEPYPIYPIGLDYVINAISPPHLVKAIDLNEIKGGSALISILADYIPDIIGISIRNVDNADGTSVKTFIGEMASLIRLIRQNSKGLIILGGSGFTIFPSEIMNYLDADFSIIGEGEKLAYLLKALEHNEPIPNIHGIVTRRGPIIFPKPLSEIPCRYTIPHHTYTSFYLKRGGMLNIQTKRGCPFQCVYCVYPHIEGKRFRFMQPDDVARTAKMLQDAGAKYLYITDSTFNGSYTHSMNVARAIKKAGVSIPWGGFFTPTNPPPDYYQILANAGLTHVEFGTEALDNSVLKAHKKPFLREDVFASHGMAIAAGIHVAHYLMLGGPGETEDTLNETLSSTDQLKKSVFFVFTGVRIYPKTALYELALKEGQIDLHTNLLEPTFYWSRALNREIATQIIKDRVDNRINWILGSGSPQMFKVVARLHKRGYVGPLWEHLIR